LIAFTHGLSENLAPQKYKRVINFRRSLKVSAGFAINQRFGVKFTTFHRPSIGTDVNYEE